MLTGPYVFHVFQMQKSCRNIKQMETLSDVSIPELYDLSNGAFGFPVS